VFGTAQSQLKLTETKERKQKKKPGPKQQKRCQKEAGARQDTRWFCCEIFFGPKLGCLWLLWREAQIRKKSFMLFES
jgi:hypothetical protein